MKFRTFRLLVTIGVTAAAAAGGFLLFRSCGKDAPDREQAETRPAARPEPVQPQPPTPVPQAPVPAQPIDPATITRSLDTRILARAKQPVSGGKLKDAFPGEREKVSFYADQGTRVNRAKVDLDRDDKWDEKWTFDEAGGVKRQVSPADDDTSYTQEYFFVNGSWSTRSTPAIPERISPSATTPTPIPPPTAAGGTPLRDMDREILLRANQDIDGDKVKDAIPGGAWKLNLYKDAGEPRVNRAKVDLDRDDKWDEKWTFAREGDRDEVKRQVAPNDDESYTEEYRLRGGTWVKK
jgi:hypothetical protein